MTITRAHSRSRTLVTMSTITVVALAISTLSACLPFAPGPNGEQELRLYDGPIPAPAPLTLEGSPGGARPQPTPPSDVTDTEAMKRFETEIEAWVEEMQKNQPSTDTMMEFSQQLGQLTEATKRSDEASVAAWQSLLVASGIAVGYGPLAVTVGNSEGLGIPMSSGELRMHALLGAAPGRMALTQLADLIEGFGIFGDNDVTEALYHDISGGASTFHLVLSMLNPDTFIATNELGGYYSIAPEGVLLNGAQVGLIIRKLSAEVMIHAEQAGALDGTPVASRAGDLTRHLLRGGGGADGLGLPLAVPLPAAAGDGPCGTDETPFRAELRKNGAKAYNEFVFSKLSKLLVTGSFGAYVNSAIAGANLGSALAKFFMLEASFSMHGSPLVRTKNREPGDKKDVTVRMNWMKTAGEDARQCLAAILAPYGVGLQDQTSGDAGGIDVNFSLPGDRLWLDTSSGASTANYLQQTASNGEAVFPVVGKPQNDVLPDGAEPEEVTSRAEVAANIEGSDLIKDLTSAAWDAISPGLAGIMVNILSRMKLIEFYWDVPVRDWTLEGIFDVTIRGDIVSHYATNMTGRSQPECGGSWSSSRSTTSWGTITSTQPHRVKANYVSASADGQTVTGILFRSNGMELHEIAIDSHNGGELAHVPVTLSLTQSTSEPGVDPMPKLYTDPAIAGCGDGEGGAAPTADCGTRDFLAIATINTLNNAVHITSRDKPIGDNWRHCGTLWPQSPASAPNSLGNCPGAQLGGGLVPSADVVFSSRGSFQITGTTDCFRDLNGALTQYTLEWTLDFCRIKDGERAC